MTDNPSPVSVDSGVSGSTIKQDKREKDKKFAPKTRRLGDLWKVSSPLSMISTNNKVGSSFSSGQPQQALANYNQQQQLQGLILPISSRRVRDSSSLLFMLATLGFLAYIIWDGIFIKQTDINLIVHGHDSYGNICGRDNRAIQFVEKSGKNYSSKPYTKYTLINAQFERYTLDSDKLKQGELFYIRQQDGSPFDGPQWRGRANDEAELEQARYSRIASQAGGPTRISSNSTTVARLNRNKREIEVPSSALLAASQRNQTLLKQLKSSLMHQYPLLHGYNNHATDDSAVTKPRRGDTNSSSSSSSSLSARQSQDRAASRANDSASSGAQWASNQYAARNGDVPLEAAKDAPEPGARTKLQTQTSSRSTIASSIDSVRHPVYFDDNLTETDLFNHMLITPINTNTNTMRPRRPDGFYANELGTHQLLYLTECVDHCPADHVELIFYRCMPRNWRFSLFPNAINVTRTFIDDIFTDMTHCYKELIYIFSLAFVLSLGLLILLRFLASLIIWSCLMLLIGLFLSMASYAWLNYYYLILDLNNSLPNNSVYSEKLASSDKWLIGAIFLTFVTFAAVATILFMRKRILMVTMLFRESGKAIADMPLLILQPVLTFATLVTITTIWSFGLICLQSIRTPTIDMSTGFVVFKSETLYKVMKWYHIFTFLWISHFAIACQHYVIGASVSKWYFSTDRYHLHSPIGSSVSELILYYLGSVALGSFLVAIFKVIKLVVRQIQYLVQRNCMQPHSQATGGSNQGQLTVSGPQMQASTSCCGSLTYLWKVFIWFFDNIVMIINRDAYVEVAIHGHSFLKGAQRALTVLASNPLRLLAIKSVGSILLVIAKMCVVFGTVSMAIVLIDDKTHQLNYSWSPVVVSALFAYVVAHWFLSVYEMVIDALFICYCEDYERSKIIEATTGSNHINGSNFMAQILNNGQIY